MKKISIILIFCFLFISTVFCVFKSGIFRKSESDILQALNKIFIGNEMIVKTSQSLKLEKVKIKIASSEKSVFENGKFLNNLEESYGGPNFDVFYDGNLIGKALHDNTNDWYVNEFIFNFFELNGKVKFNFITNGKDRNGDEGYIWIEKNMDKLNFQSFEPNGKLINQWNE